MNSLIIEPNIEDPDGFYAELLELHEGRSDDESDALNARLVLILANHIGDRSVLRQAFELSVAAGSGRKADETESKGKSP